MIIEDHTGPITQRTLTDYGRFVVVKEHYAPEHRSAYSRTWIQPGDCVAVIPYNVEGFWVGEQPREPIRKRTLSTCAGRIDPDETPFLAAKRELGEEFGMRGEDWKLLGSFYSSEGITDEHTTIYAVKDPVFDPTIELDADEFVEPHFIKWERADEIIAIADNAKLLIGLMKLQRKKMKEDFIARYGNLTASFGYRARPVTDYSGGVARWLDAND